MKIITRNLMFLVMLALVVLTIGCSDGKPRSDVFGEVSFDGKPVEAGMVVFEPAEAVAPPRNVLIQNGKYHADGACCLTPGSYCIRITAADLSKMNPGGVKDMNTLPEYIPLLPPPWNTQSKLSVDVKPGKNTFHFRGKKSETPSVETGIEK